MAKIGKNDSLMKQVQQQVQVQAQPRSTSTPPSLGSPLQQAISVVRLTQIERDEARLAARPLIRVFGSPKRVKGRSKRGWTTAKV